MTEHKTRHYAREGNITRASKIIVVLFGLAAVGYIGVAVVEHTRPLLGTASSFMLESRMVNLEPPTEARDAQASSGAAAAAVPATPAANSGKEFDYFPDHYVNHATKVEDPIATF